MEEKKVFTQNCMHVLRVQAMRRSEIKISKWTIALHAENLSANFSVYDQAHIIHSNANAFVI